MSETSKAQEETPKKSPKSRNESGNLQIIQSCEFCNQKFSTTSELRIHEDACEQNSENNRISETVEQEGVEEDVKPEIKKMLQLINAKDHYVYGIFLKKVDKINIHECFYIGEGKIPQDRFMWHIKECKAKTNNSLKCEYFKKYSHDRIRMIILHKGPMGECMVIEKFLIVTGNTLNCVCAINLTNSQHNKSVDENKHMSIAEEIKVGLTVMINEGILKNNGFDADKVKFSEEQIELKKKDNKNRNIQKHSNKQVEKLNNLRFSIPPLEKLVALSIVDQQSEWLFPGSVTNENQRNANLRKLEEVIYFRGPKIVEDSTIINPNDIVGTFLNMTEETFRDMVKDFESAIKFAARTGIIPNELICPSCDMNKKMTLYKRSKKWKWKCLSYGPKDKNTCDDRPLTYKTYLHEEKISVDKMILMLFYISRGLSDKDVLSKFAVITENLLEGIVKIFKKEILDQNLRLYSNQARIEDISKEQQLRELFFADKNLDHFGLILRWIIPEKRIIPEKPQI